MKYDELEKEIKKLAETVKEFPPEIREKSFDVLLGALIKEKRWGLETGTPPKSEITPTIEFPVIAKISEATDISAESLLDIYDPSTEGLKIDIGKLAIESAAERTKAYVRLLYLYKKNENRRFTGMPSTELREFVKAQGEPENANLLRDLKNDSQILTARKEGKNIVLTIKPNGPQKIIDWIKNRLSEKS